MTVQVIPTHMARDKSIFAKQVSVKADIPQANHVARKHNNLSYPETDGKPIAESDLHREIIFYLIHLLQRFFAGQEVYVSGNLLIYYEPGNWRKSVAPDCFVVWGVEAHRRRSYKIWEEGKGPEVVFGISSKSTSNEDLTTKFGLYAQMGVKEYFVYDPTSDYLDPPLIAYELIDGQGFVPKQSLNQEATPDAQDPLPDKKEPPIFESKRMGLRLTLSDQNDLLLYDIQTGKRLLSDEEENRCLHEEIAQLKEQLGQ